MKRIALILAVLLLLLACSSCGIPELFELDSDLHNVIEIGYTDTHIEEIFYHGVRYVRFELKIFGIPSGFEPHEEDMMLSWNGPLFFYKNVYYSDTADSPYFIYEIRMGDLYFREDYDYKSELYSISATEMKLSEMMGEPVDEKNIRLEEPPLEIPIVSKTNPRFHATIELGCMGEDWYLSFLGTEKVWRATPKLLNAVGVLESE